MNRYILLVLLWVSWCALHSVLITPTVTDRLRGRFPSGFRFYRMFYNVTAVVTLVPVLVFGFSLRGPVLFDWEGGWRTVQFLLLVSALWFFAAGARRYDFLQFLGLRQVRGDETCGVLTEDCSLDTGGVLSVVRHPWYTGGMLIVWARPLDLAGILTNTVITGYFIVGACLEERKLKQQFGRAYTEYQQSVSMFFPIRWTLDRLLAGRGRPK